MARVELEQLTKLFRGPTGEEIGAVDQLDLAVTEGELLVLLGPSGCGKTTLLRLIAGLESPTSGTIRIDNQLANGLPPGKRDVAMVFQTPALYPHLTIAENLGFGLKLRGISGPDREERVREAAEMLGITDCLARRPMELSGGEKQRAALGRAIVRRPKLILLDEPLSNLDAPLRARMRIELARLQRRLSTTMIYVTHDQDEAMSLGTRLAVMRSGTIQQVGETGEVYDFPSNIFVAGFVGTPAMNLLTGRFSTEGNELAFHLDSAGTAPILPLGLPAAPEGAPSTNRIILGLRPEDVVVCNRQTRLAGTVELIERHSGDIFAHVRLGQHLVIAKLSAGADGRPGQHVNIQLEAARAHFFDARTGERIAQGR